MSGKAAVVVVIVVIIIATILTWMYLQHVIDEFDIDRAMNDVTYVMNCINPLHTS